MLRFPFVALYALPAMRHMEAILPDYEPVAAAEPAEDSGVGDGVPVEGELAPVG